MGFSRRRGQGPRIPQVLLKVVRLSPNSSFSTSTLYDNCRNYQTAICMINVRVMRLTVHTGLEKTPFELHHGRKLRTELTNIVKDGKTSSDLSVLSISAIIRPKIPIYVGRDAEGEITNHIVMAKNKTEEKNLAEGPMSPKKKNSVSYPFKFMEENHNRKSVEGKFQNKIQTAVSGTKNTVKTDTGKIFIRKFISSPLFQTEKKTRQEPAPMSSGKIQPKNRHCLRGLDGKNGRWDEIPRFTQRKTQNCTKPEDILQ